jgi:DNA-binding transcriptional MerR regulator
MTAKEGPPMADDERRDVTVVLTPATATAMAGGPVTVKETWPDWIPDEGRDDALLDAEPLLTRDELVAELKQGSVDVTPRELTRWQSLGVIPYPQKRRHKSTTVGVYPQWAINTIHLLKSLQEQGYKLREIGPLLRGDTYHRFTSYPKTPRQQRDHDRRLARQAFFPLMGELDPRIRSLARVYERIHGGRITQAEVRLIDDQGKAHVYPFLTSKGEADENIGVERLG